MDVLDYGRSYLGWDAPIRPAPPDDPGARAWGNSVRIQLDARTRIIDERTGRSEDYYLIAPCRRERMYRDDDRLIHRDPPGEYRLAWSRTRSFRFGQEVLSDGWRRASQPLSAHYLRVDLQLTAVPSPRALPSDAEIVAASQSAQPIVVHTEIRSAARGRRAVLEYPVRTMNYLAGRQRFQVDTGPLMWADLDSDLEEPIEWLWLAHTVYNRL
ncbi:MAG: hypothetical protein FJ029_09470, partial [Actinobacteria bacterium]|nr:hypothetical protein [Actinomycetota bacterium]